MTSKIVDLHVATVDRGCSHHYFCVIYLSCGKSLSHKQSFTSKEEAWHHGRNNFLERKVSEIDLSHFS